MSASAKRCVCPAAQHSRRLLVPRRARRGGSGRPTSAGASATQSPSYMGCCPPAVQDLVGSIRQAVAHSNCAPYADLADESTLIVNPPWADQPRAMGLSDAACGITTPTHYTEEHVRPIAAAYETDGSVFLLWERRAVYTTPADSKEHSEDICGVTYVKQNDKSECSVIATFRQPSQEELVQNFPGDHGLAVRPGSGNFFRGEFREQENPVFEQQMLACVRQFYSSWNAGSSPDALEDALSHIASPSLHVHEPVWERRGEYLPVNRVEAAMWMERAVKDAGGRLQYNLKAVAHAEGTNMVFAFWFAQGLDDSEIAGVHVFFFTPDLKIRSIASFREPTKEEREAMLKR